MIDILKRHGVNLFWTFGIFLAAFLFYVATSAFMPYPGISAGYLTAVCYPEHSPALLSSAIDAVVLKGVLSLPFPGSLNTILHLLYAAIGAGIVTCLFRCAIAAARHASMDLTGIRSNELDRTLFAISHVSFETGLATALLALVALPIWAIGTRPYPEAFQALILAAMLTFALEFRWRATQRYVLDLAPQAQHGLTLGVCYALMSFTLFSAPALIPVILFTFILANGIFIKPDARGRGFYLLFAGGGIVVGLTAAITFTAQHAHLLNVAHAPLPGAVVLWGQAFAQQLATLVSHYTSFEGVAPLVIFLSGAALFLGIFPQAYLKFASPIIGQLACIALIVAAVLQWPASVRGLLSEPSAMGLIASATTVLCVGVIFGSWLHTFLESRTRWPHARMRLFSFIGMLTICGGLAIFLAINNAPAGSGLSLRRAVRDRTAALDELLPEQATLWLTSQPDTLGIIARRYLAGNPIYPQAETLDSVTPASLTSHQRLRYRAEQDELIPYLTETGAEPLRQYLMATAAEHGVVLQLPPRLTATRTAAMAKHLASTEFGKTTIGQHLIVELKRIAARAHAACAIAAEPEAAAAHLRLAHELDPENPGVSLSLAALADKGVTITQAERNAARDVLEANPALREPTEGYALNFEYQYGPVCAPGFCSASRLRRFHLGNAQSVLQEILALYQSAPEELSPTERAVALLHLPEEKAAKKLTKRTASDDELELFFCLYPDHPTTAALYEQYQNRFRDNDALTVLLKDQQTHFRDRIADKLHAFFLRDGSFAYALFYLNDLLKKNDLETAITFADSFNVRERLAKTPVLSEDLRYRVLTHLHATDPQRARAVCTLWLQNNPRQYRLWNFLLTDAYETSPDPEAEVRACLNHYPLHPAATRHYAEFIRKDLGEAAAKRYLSAVKTATQTGSCLQKDTHAHSRL